MASDPDGARARLRRAGVEVLLEDNHLLCVAKPAGLLSQGGPPGETSLVDVLAAYRQGAEGKSGPGYVGLVHRLDRNASGAMVVAKTSKAAARLSAQFRERAEGLVKEYLAWVAGVPREDRASLAMRLAREEGVTSEAAADDEDAREARLSYVVEARGPNAARLRVLLETGRTHQIRAMLAAQGLPLHGDPKYGGPPAERPALHAHRLCFLHPIGNKPVAVEAPVPADLLRLNEALALR